MNDSTSTVKDKAAVPNKTIVAYRISRKLVPMFEELSDQVHQAGLIQEPTVNTLAKFALSFFADLWLKQQQAAAQKQQYEQSLHPQPRDSLQQMGSSQDNWSSRPAYPGGY